LEFRKRLIKRYDFLFGTTNAEEPDDSTEFSETYQFAKQWGWYQSIYAIAQGDITRFDAVTNYKLTQCLTYLTFEKQKQEIEQRQLNKIRK
jgi:hypothetical protein